jgi:curved DNA-binding protein CbpA
VPSCDVRALPLSPTDAFVLSRVDGVVGATDLSLLTGLGADEVEATLGRLADLGAIAWGDGPSSQRAERPRPSRVVTKRNDEVQRPIVEVVAVAPDEPSQPSPGLYDPSELDEDVDLPPERRRRILDVYYRLDDRSHYELLGVDSSADKKAVKAAYYEVAAEYHPDKYFRKRLGSFKAKMEVIFGRLTLAHDTLTRKQTREEYDAYLLTRTATRDLESTLREGEVKAAEEEEELRRTLERQVEAPAASSAQAVRQDPVLQQARREAFARRLLGRHSSQFPRGAAAAASQPPASPTPPVSQPRAPSSPPPAAAQSAAEDLRRRYREQHVRMRRTQLEQYVGAAEQAKARGDAVEAANAYRLALAIAPDDEMLRVAAEQAQLKASEVLAESYLKQGTYEERAERWPDAARSLARAAEGYPRDASVQARAAHALLKAGGDLHRAAQFGQRAVEIEPKNAAHRLTLAQVYAAADLSLNARRELEAAAALAPQDATIAAMLKSLRKA